APNWIVHKWNSTTPDLRTSTGLLGGGRRQLQAHVRQRRKRLLRPNDDRSLERQVMVESTAVQLDPTGAGHVEPHLDGARVRLPTRRARRVVRPDTVIGSDIRD